MTEAIERMREALNGLTMATGLNGNSILLGMVFATEAPEWTQVAMLAAGPCDEEDEGEMRMIRAFVLAFVAANPVEVRDGDV